MRKSCIRIVAFGLILCIILLKINSIFKFKYSDGIYGLTKFYELEDDTVDVLVLGSSHAFEDVNTGVLWEKYGISSFDLCGSIQPLWNTYYYLKEALKTQTPELIVLEGYATCIPNEYMDDSRIIKNTYGMHWSKDKLDAIRVSAPKERWSEFILEYEQYHTRYRELSDADFIENQNYRLYDDWKGFGCALTTSPQETIDVSGITDKLPLCEKAEKYYRMILNLAKDREIPIVVIISPYAGITENDQMLFNTAKEIAEEYDVAFKNFNLDYAEIGLDYSTDAADIAHLNYKGNQKFTTYLGKYLKGNFNISDHRGDSKYASWQRNADYINQIIADQELVESTNLDEIPERLNNENYWIAISVDGTCSTSDENIKGFLNQLGIYDESVNGIWIRENNTITWKTGESANLNISTSAHDFSLTRSYDENGIYNNAVIIDNIQYKKVINGVNITVYDKKTEKIADSFGIDMDNGYQIVR